MEFCDCGRKASRRCTRCSGLFCAQHAGGFTQVVCVGCSHGAEQSHRAAAETEAKELLARIRVALDDRMRSEAPPDTLTHQERIDVGPALLGNRLPACPHRHPRCEPREWVGKASKSGKQRRRLARFAMPGWNVLAHVALENVSWGYGDDDRKVPRTLFLATDRTLYTVRDAEPLCSLDALTFDKVPAATPVSSDYIHLATVAENAARSEQDSRRQLESKLATLRNELDRLRGAPRPATGDS